MKKTFIQIFWGLILSVVSFSASADYNQQCQLNKFLYMMPHMAGCDITINQSGQITSKLLGKKVSMKECLSVLGMGGEEFENQLIGVAKKMKTEAEANGYTPPLLLVEEQNGTIRAKLISKLFPDEGMIIPAMKKNLGGTAYSSLDNGLNIKLKVENTAELTMSGDFGTYKFSGPCLD